MKTRWIPLIGTLAVLGCNMNAVQGSGVAKTERRTLGSFDEVLLVGSFETEVRIGPTSEAVVTADDNLLALIETEVKGSKLHIRPKENLREKTPIKIVVTTPSLQAASVTGSADLTVVALESDEFVGSVTGSGKLLASGTARMVKAGVTGSGLIDLTDVTAATADANVTGSGSIIVNAKDAVEASITGSGEVAYLKNPKVTESITGSGSVRAQK